MSFSKFRKAGIAFASIAALSLGVFTLSIKHRSTLPPPAHWTIFPSSPDDHQRLCANYSNLRWKVSSKADEIQINPIEPHRPEIKPITLPFRGGILIGEDGGEWGGALYWTGPDGNKTKIYQENIHYLIHTSFGTLALTGLAHLTINSGGVVKVSEDGELPPKTELIASLSGAPLAYTLDSTGNVIVVSMKAVERIRPPGVVEKIASVDYTDVIPNSIAITQSGIIYVGMSLFTTRLIPTGYQNVEEWLIPESCADFAVDGFECRCKTK